MKLFAISILSLPVCPIFFLSLVITREREMKACKRLRAWIQGPTWVFPSHSQSYPIDLKDFPNVTSFVRKATFHPSTKN